MTYRVLLLALGILITWHLSVYASKEVPYTLDDRDRLIRLETKVEEGLKAVNQKIDEGLKAVNQRIDEGLRAVNQRIDSMEKRIDSLQQLIYILISAVIAQTIGVIGFVLWDRRTAISPVVRKARELEDREERIERALKELAKEDEKVAKALKTAGLL